MFNLELSKQVQLNIAGRFEPFEKEGCKLPSFSICVNTLNEDEVKVLNVQKQVGDYTFYEKTEQGHWWSFCGSYLCINEQLNCCDVYLSEHVKTDGVYEVTNLLMQAYMYRLVDTGNFMIHSAATVFENQGIIFCGLSGAGKSTQANLWKEHLEAKMLNYDKPCILHEGKNVYVHGSPWSGKEGLYLNEYAPLKAIVFVKQAKENKVVRLSPAQAYAHTYLHNYVYPLTKEIEAKYASVIQETAVKVPMYELYCDISEQAVEVLFDELFPQTTYQQYKKEQHMKYKIKDCFEMKQIADEFIVIPRGTEALDFNATVVFNESGAFLWDLMLDFTDAKALSDALIEKYSIDSELAKKDVQAFLDKMEENDLIESME